MAAGYSEEIWNALKELWQSTPKISWAKLVDEVAKTLKCDLPSPSIVRRRAVAENWKKSVKKTLKKTSKEIREDIQNLTSKIDKENTDNSRESNVKDEVIDEVVSDVINRVITSQDSQKRFDFETASKKAQGEELKASQIILKNRYRNARLGALFDTTMDSIDHVKEEAAKTEVLSDEELEKSIDEQNLILDQHAFKLSRKMNFVAGLAELLDLMTKSSERLMKGDCVMWGLELEDFKDREMAKVKHSEAMKALDGKLEERKKIMLMDKRAALMRDIKLIEEGEPTSEDEEDELELLSEDAADGQYQDNDDE